MSSLLRRVAPLLAGFLAVAAIPALAEEAAAVAAQPSGEEVLARASKAMGAEAAAKHQNRLQKGSFAMPAQGMSGSFATYSAPPNKFLNVITMEMIGEMKQGHDGTTAWSNDAMQGPRLLSKEELEGMLLEANFDSDLSSVFPDTQTIGAATFEGSECWKLSMKMATGSETIGYFDQSTGLMMGMERKMKSPMGEVPVTIVLSGYTEMEGMKVPQKTVLRMAGMEQVMTLTGIEVNLKEMPSFSPPPEVAALMKGEN